VQMISPADAGDLFHLQHMCCIWCMAANMDCPYFWTCLVYLLSGTLK